MDSKASTAMLLLVVALLPFSEALPYGALRTDQLQAIAVSQRIQEVIFSITEIQKFELANAPTFFPIGQDFFDLMEYMRLINVNRYTLGEIRDYTFREVRDIHKLIYGHQIKLSEFVEQLASTAFSVKNGDNNPEQLTCILRGIDDFSSSLIIDLWGIIMRIENLSEEFVYRVEDAIQDVPTEPSDLDIIRDRATTLSQSYADKYAQFAILMEKVQTDFGKMMPALVTYIELVKAESKHQINEV